MTKSRFVLNRTLCTLCLVCALDHQSGLAAPITTPYIATLNYFAGGLQRYDAKTGALIDTIGELPLRRSELNIGPDGNFYVTISNQFEIKRIDARTGATTQFIDASQIGHIRGMDFGPNGNLFVASPSLGSILEFNGQTGQFIRYFIRGIATPIDLDFAPNGSLFVARGHQQISGPSSILEYDGQTGAFIRTFATTQVDTPQNILVGPTGDVFVTNQWINAAPLVRFDGITGAVKFAVDGGLNNPQGMAFGVNGELLVASWHDSIKRFNAGTGVFLGNLVVGGSLDDPIGVIFVPEPSTLLLGMVTLVTLPRYRRTRFKIVPDA
jgi:WD40 repeat protein